MIIGTHEIKGAVEKLDQPYCVLQKNTNSNCDETNQRNTVSSTTIDNTVTTTTSYELVGVVTSKILFKNYPKTIVRR